MTVYAVGAAVLSAIHYAFHAHGILFVLYFAMNLIDLASALIKRHLLKNSSEKTFEKIAFKKLLYWMMLAVSFGISAVFIEIGKEIGADLGVSALLGWFVLGSLMLNDLRSFLQNLLDCGVRVPTILRRTLTLAEKALDEEVNYDGTLTVSRDGAFDVEFEGSVRDAITQESVLLKVRIEE